MGSLEFKQIKLPQEIGAEISLYVSETINSHQPNYRNLIRIAMAETLKKDYSESKNTQHLLDIEKLPIHKNYAMSISHCKSLSGFVISPHFQSVGLDIENLERISLPVINRIASRQEQDRIPDKRFLFPMKEAAWKAISKAKNLPTISHIEILNWQPDTTDSGYFFCGAASNKFQGVGYCMKLKNHIVSLYYQ